MLEGHGDLNFVPGVLALRQKGEIQRGYAELLGVVKAPEELIANPDLAEQLPPLREALLSKDVIESTLEEIAVWRKKGIQLVALGTDGYPSFLAAIFEPPPILFYKGQLSCPDSAPARIAIVGSRKADRSGVEIAGALARELAALGTVIVSGLAYGIDCQAHLGAMAATGGVTWAVLGSGVDLIYPASHHQVAQQILQSGGALLSQFEPGTKPFPQNFLNRNRVIAGLAEGVIVVQAAERSGSLVTARYAMEEGREVMVIPGAITDPLYVGSNRLIKQGAYLVTNLTDVLEIIPALQQKLVAKEEQGQSGREKAQEKDWRRKEDDSNEKGGAIEEPEACYCQREVVSESAVLNSVEKLVLRELQQTSTLHLDVLLERLQNQASQGEFHVALMTLELAGKLLKLPGNYVALKPIIN